MKKILIRFSKFSLGTFLGAFLSLVQVPILIYFLSPDEYGKANFFRTLITQIPVFLYLGFDHAFVSDYHDVEDKKYLFKNSIFIPLISAILLIVITFIFQGKLSTWMFDDESFKHLVWLGTMFMISVIFERFILLSIRMDNKAGEYSLFTAMSKVLNFLLSLLLVFVGKTDFTIIVYSLVISQLLADVFLFYRYRELLTSLDSKFDFEFIKEQFKFGFPQMVSVTLISFLTLIENMSLKSFSTDYDIGIYSLSLTIASIVGILRTAFSSFWLPTAYQWNKENKSGKHFVFITDIVLFVLFLGIFLIQISKPILMVLISFEYYPVLNVLLLSVMVHLLATLSEITGLGILFSKKTFYNFYISIIIIIISILLNIYLTPSYGYIGTSIASAISYLIFFISKNYVSSKLGYKFHQKKHTLILFLLLSYSVLVSFGYEDFVIACFVFVTCLILQKDFFIKLINIKKNPEDWDFT